MKNFLLLAVFAAASIFRASAQDQNPVPSSNELALRDTSAVQDSGLYMYGVVKNIDTMDSIPFPTITYRDVKGGPATAVQSTSKGKYEIYFPAGKIYRIDFDATGRMTKSVEIDLKNVPATFKAGEFAVNVDMTLSEALPGLHASVFEKPIGKCRYDAPTDNMKWDEEYTTKITAQWDAVMEKYQSKHKGK
jgi:hypothetical protein